MIALDTNVLVRHLVEDDAAQTARAAQLIEAAAQRGEPLYVGDVVLCEVVWVLTGAYQVARTEVAGVLRRLLQAQQLTFGAADQLRRALDAFEHGRGDFADYLIREQALAAGCTAVATFDRALLRETGFVAP